MADTNQYADRDHRAQGDYYLRHVSAMTGEGLHAKSAIAGELAHRDMVIDAQAAEIKRLRGALGLIVRRHELEQHVELFGRDCDQKTLMELYGLPAPHRIAGDALATKGGE